MTAQKDLKLGRQWRAATFQRDTVNAESRTVELAFSSEEPVDRWWGTEILGHAAGECDLSWFNGGTAPCLVDHDNCIDSMVGVIVSARTGNDGVNRAVVRFAKDEESDEVFQKVQDGIVANVSVGYELLKLALVEENKDAPSIYRATQWRPLEISLVAVPADMTVGVGRAQDDSGRPVIIDLPPKKTETTMEKTPAEIAAEAEAERSRQAALAASRATEHADILKNERQRIVDLEALGGRHNMMPLAREHIAKGTTIEQFRGLVLEKIGESKPLYTPQNELGLSRRETANFSMTRALASQLQGINIDASFERECSDEIAKRTGHQPRGILVPYDVMTEKRDLTVGTSADGGYTVATELRPQDFIELLRNRMMVRQMGARILSGLQGNVAFPKQSVAGTFYWVAENGGLTESQQTLAQVTMSPKTGGASTDYSRQLLLQSSISIENFIRADLAAIIGLGIDLAALHGTGSSNQPTGLASTSGIGSVAGGTNGANPTWAHIVSLETKVAVANADVGNLGYLTNAKVRGQLKQTLKNSAGTDVNFIWGDNMAAPGYGMVNGYKAGVSNQVSSTLTKGNQSLSSAIFYGDWSTMMIGEWGVLDLFADPYTGGDAGTVRVRAFMSVDVAIRTAASFSAMLDALTP